MDKARLAGDANGRGWSDADLYSRDASGRALTMHLRLALEPSSLLHRCRRSIFLWRVGRLMLVERGVLRHPPATAHCRVHHPADEPHQDLHAGARRIRRIIP
jgi:hypothetical protein